ncbi:MAG: hypothetical protein IK066_03410 [Kiritimatiellae bacterium]|nr:hypothetical protein [Kiritimatiellia bacterium]
MKRLLLSLFTIPFAICIAQMAIAFFCFPDRTGMAIRLSLVEFLASLLLAVITGALFLLLACLVARLFRRRTNHKTVWFLAPTLAAFSLCTFFFLLLQLRAVANQRAEDRIAKAWYTAMPQTMDDVRLLLGEPIVETDIDGAPLWMYYPVRFLSIPPFPHSCFYVLFTPDGMIHQHGFHINLNLPPETQPLPSTPQH